MSQYLTPERLLTLAGLPVTESQLRRLNESSEEPKRLAVGDYVQLRSSVSSDKTASNCGIVRALGAQPYVDFFNGTHTRVSKSRLVKLSSSEVTALKKQGVAKSIPDSLNRLKESSDANCKYVYIDLYSGQPDIMPSDEVDEFIQHSERQINSGEVCVYPSEESLVLCAPQGSFFEVDLRTFKAHPTSTESTIGLPRPRRSNGVSVWRGEEQLVVQM
jgi:hypothetical protein